MHYDNRSARYVEQCDELVVAIGERATLIQLVAYMGTAIRNYLQPRSDVLDRSIDNNDDAQSTALIDLIPDPSHRQQRL
jgi:hypothetical protein